MNSRICPDCNENRLWCPHRQIWWCENCDKCLCPPHRDCHKCQIGTKKPGK